MRVERDGVVIATLPYTVDAAANAPRPDVVAPSGSVPTLQAAIDAATDRNQDGRIVVALRAGLYRESVVIDRALDLVGAGRELTVLQGDGSAPVLVATASNVVIRGLTVIGGTRGVQLAGQDTPARRQHRLGKSAGGCACCRVRRPRCDSARRAENGGDGVRIAAGSAQLPAQLARRQRRQWRQHARRRTAAGSAIASRSTAPTACWCRAPADATVTGNRIAANAGTGVFLDSAPNATVDGNVCALNDEDGLHLDRSDGTLAIRNALHDNNGYGLFLRRSAATDFDAAAGLQAPPGDNDVSGNRKQDVFIRPD